jgi:hypothetical protein
VLWPVQRLTLEYLGLGIGEPFVCYGTPRVDDATRAGYLRQWKARVTDVMARDYTRTAAEEIAAQVAGNASSWASRA